MAIYAIGDVQGCFRSLLALLKRIDYDESRDRLWFAGDLVNRGPRSLEVVRWIHERRDAVTVVMGNHDLHLVRRFAGHRKAKLYDTLGAALAAPDAAGLVDWLRTVPLLHSEGPYLLVHAGLLPSWTVAEAEARANRVQSLLRSPDYADALAALPKEDERKQTIAVMTRLRTIDASGRATFGYAGPPEGAPEGQIPWYSAPDRQHTDVTIVFGHWASMGHRMAPGRIALDSGCVYGHSLTAVRLEDRAVFQVPYSDA